MSTRAPVSLVSVYDGQTCIGFLLSRGCRGIEAFDAAERSLGLGRIAQPIRVAVSGSTISPPIDATLAILGRQESLARIGRAIQYAETSSVA